jgi:hypothetical protein
MGDHPRSLPRWLHVFEVDENCDFAAFVVVTNWIPLIIYFPRVMPSAHLQRARLGFPNDEGRKVRDGFVRPLWSPPSHAFGIIIEFCYGIP